jgi:hypothetical protein
MSRPPGSVSTDDQSISMREQLERRLHALRAEFESGQQLMADLEDRQARLRDTLLRISGAIQVLEEELGERPANSSIDGALA